ncbi:MAG: hypothetical protein ACHQZQ_06260 [SAR324 cluster bacterium]
MEPWSFAHVLSFLMAHAGQRIAVRQRGTALRLVGHLADLGDRDACSMDLVEAELDLGIPGLQCVMTLHEATLLVHLSGGSGEVGLYFPMSIPYSDLVLEGGGAARQKPEAESRSPDGPR